MIENVNSERVTAAELSRLTNLSRAWISRLKKEGKLIFSQDPDGREKINFQEALKQLEGSKDYKRENQREWAVKQRNGKAINLNPGTGGINPDNPFNLKDGTAFIIPNANESCKDTDIGKETQKAALKEQIFKSVLKEIEFKEKTGELVSAAGIMAANRRIAGSIRSKFIGMGTKLAPRLENKPAAEIQRIIEDEINVIFTGLYMIGGGKEEL